jgi:hypothetical protein
MLLLVLTINDYGYSKLMPGVSLFRLMVKTLHQEAIQEK